MVCDSSAAAVPSIPRTVDDLVQQGDPTVRPAWCSRSAAADSRGSASSTRPKRNSCSSTSSTWSSTSARFSSASRARCSMPSTRSASADHRWDAAVRSSFSGVVVDLAREQPVDQPHLGVRVVVVLGEMPGERRFGDEQRDHRAEFVRQRGQPRRPADCLPRRRTRWSASSSACAAGGPQPGRRAGLDHRRRRRHLVQVGQEAIDRR